MTQLDVGVFRPEACNPDVRGQVVTDGDNLGPVSIAGRLSIWLKLATHLRLTSGAEQQSAGY